MILSSERCRRTPAITAGRSCRCPHRSRRTLAQVWPEAARAVSAPARRGPAEPALQSGPGLGWRPVSQAQDCWPEVPHGYGAVLAGEDAGEPEAMRSASTSQVPASAGALRPEARRPPRSPRGSPRPWGRLERPGPLRERPRTRRAGRRRACARAGRDASDRVPADGSQGTMRGVADAVPPRWVLVGEGCLAGSSQNGHVRPAPCGGPSMGCPVAPPAIKWPGSAADDLAHEHDELYRGERCDPVGAAGVLRRDAMQCRTAR